MTTSPAIRARGVIAVHGAGGTAAAALRGLDLEVEPGTVTAIVGPSGSGKTSLLRILAGTARPTAGSVVIDGTVMERATAADIDRHRRDVVAVVDQHYRRALSPYLPAQQIVELPLALRGVAPRERAERAAALLELVGLTHRRGARPRQLSGGEQQRRAVAAAMAAGPRILLADEPTGELDDEATVRLLSAIRDVVDAEGVAAVIVTHDAAVEHIADRLVVLQDGRAVAVRDGMPDAAEVPLVDDAGWRAPEHTWRHRPHGRHPRHAGAATTSRASSPPAASTPAAVELTGIGRTYRDAAGDLVAIRDVSLAIPGRGVHVITGPSGSGKSTLLRIVAGLDRPDAGTAIVLGRDLASLDRSELAALRAGPVAVAEQARGLVPFLDVRENVSLGLSIRRRGSDTAPGGAAHDNAAVAAVLERLGIGSLAHRRPHELSAGERTRAVIARALVGRPALLLLDEPTSTLDRVSAAVIADLLVELGRDVAILVATHDPAIVAIAASQTSLRGGA